MILPGTGRGTAPEGRGGGGRSPIQRPEVYHARKLRKSMSLPEAMLWQRLRGSQLGMKFRRQHPVGPYVADFYCRDARLIIEIDGEAHNRGDRPEKDAARDAYLLDKGFEVLRIAAVEVLRDANAAAEGIAARLGNPLHQPVAGPPPRAGEDI
jgi:very-short-patch-repair endonuclease